MILFSENRGRELLIGNRLPHPLFRLIPVS